MKKLVFKRENDKLYEVRIYESGNDHDWLRYGKLFLNDSGNYELWTGTGYSTKGSDLENCSDDCTEYASDLDETFDLMKQELQDFLKD